MFLDFRFSETPVIFSELKDLIFTIQGMMFTKGY